MYVVDGIAYAGEQTKPVTVLSVRAMDDYKLWLRFASGETKIFDFIPLLDAAGFAPLKNKAVFDGVSIDYGVTVWDEGAIDISPEYLFANSSDC